MVGDRGTCEMTGPDVSVPTAQCLHQRNCKKGEQRGRTEDLKKKKKIKRFKRHINQVQGVDFVMRLYDGYWAI